MSLNHNAANPIINLPKALAHIVMNSQVWLPETANVQKMPGNLAISRNILITTLKEEDTNKCPVKEAHTSSWALTWVKVLKAGRETEICREAKQRQLLYYLSTGISHWEIQVQIPTPQLTTSFLNLNFLTHKIEGIIPFLRGGGVWQISQDYNAYDILSTLPGIC